MPRSNFLFLFLILFGLSAVGIANAQSSDTLKKLIEDKAKELETLNGQIQETQGKIEETRGQQKTLKKELGNLDYGISRLNLSIKSSEINIEKLGLEILSLQYNIESAENSMENHKNAIAQLLRAMQQKDDENLLLIFLKGQSLADSLFELEGINNINKNLSIEISRLGQLRDELQKVLGETNKKKNELELEKNNLTHRNVILQDQKKERQYLLAQTKNQERLYQQQLEELEKRQEEIGKEIAKIEEELRLTLDPSLIPTPRPGVLTKPTTGIITQGYGATSFAQRAYKSRFHNGIDFNAPIGTPIFAAESGKVVAVGDNGRVQFGKFVAIQHNNNLTTLYAHLSRQLVQEGAEVQRGDLIGYSGNTGYSTGPHLHFTVYITQSFLMKNFPACRCGLVPVGVTVDPMEYL